jgi:adenylate cyclase
VSEPSLDLLGGCLEGMVPSSIATVDPEGVPNVSLISQVHYVDPERVALSYQFFNKTRANLLATGRATVGMIDPGTMAEYRLALRYEETRTEGPLFESMKAKLAGIASHTGMGGVFRLLGADVFRVEAIASVPGPRIMPQPAARNLLAATRRACAELAAAGDLGGLLDTALDGLDRHFGIEHAMLLLVDEEGRRLYTVASHGYDRSGIGSELAVGQGVVGVAARERVPIRIGHMTADTDYGTAVRDQARRHGVGEETTEIPFPGLDAPESQIAVPIVCGGRTVGVLFGESREPLRFRQDDEDALTLVAERLGALIPAVQQNEDAPEPEAAEAMAGQAPIVVRHYAADDSIFLGHDYLIKGVAGAIFWKLVREHLQAGRVEFTNRELRLDPALRLPEHAENLEARLLLLQRRLRERESPIRIEKAGRGRLRLGVPAPLTLEEIGAGGA